jgi:ADP-ribose pyrophosphatase YjhB (NUDIX family)
MSKIEIAWTLVIDTTEWGPVIPVAQRRLPQRYTHTFPGGKIWRNETPIAAAQRELRHETGLHVYKGELAFTNIVHTDEYVIHPFVLILNYERSKIRNTEPLKHFDWEWYTLDGVMALIRYGQLPPYALAYSWRSIFEIFDRDIRPWQYDPRNSSYILFN